MRNIVYYVAASLDGYIAGPNADISGFVGSGNGVEQYLADLAGFDTVIMGRKTYEFGYAFGLVPGQPAYPHMKHTIFSSSLGFSEQSPMVQVQPLSLDAITSLRQQPGTDIYCCGGGQLAGWLLDHEQITILKLKLNPLVLGDGIKLFGKSKRKFTTTLLDTALYDNGLQIMTYRVNY